MGEVHDLVLAIGWDGDQDVAERQLLRIQAAVLSAQEQSHGAIFSVELPSELFRRKTGHSKMQAQMDHYPLVQAEE